MSKLTRPARGDGRMIAGVCAGVADSTGFSVTAVRLLFVIAGFVGAGELVYLALWLLMPRR